MNPNSTGDASTGAGTGHGGHAHHAANPEPLHDAQSAAGSQAAADYAHAVPSLLQEYLDLRESADR